MKRTICLNCENRHMGCHSECKEYKQYRIGIEFIKTQRAKERLSHPNHKIKKKK